ncbi:unnamed protein product [Sphagnum tenellum]
MLTVACVLRSSGNTYNASWVHRLQRNVAKHLTVPYRFVCLTNLKSIEDVETIKLTESWPGWWSKLELFATNRFNGPVLYMDLDMMSCGNIDALAQNWSGLVMLRDCEKFRHVENSGLMWFDPTKNSVYENIFHEFKTNPMETMKAYSGVNGVTMFGDQGFIARTMEKHKQPIIKWQDVLKPEWFLEFSYLDKINPKIADMTYNKDARICYSLGYPKFPNMPDHPLVKEHWEINK